MHSSREDISRSPSPRGRAPHISLTAPQNSPDQSPDARKSTSHVRSTSEGEAHGSRSHPVGRVKFIGDEETSQRGNGQSPRDALGIEGNLPRAPPVAHCYPRRESESDVSDDLVGYFDHQASSGASTPIGSSEHISSRVNLLHDDENARQEDAGEKRRALHGAHERAQRLASFIRRPSAQTKEQGGLFHRFSRRQRNKAAPPPERPKQSSWDDLDIMEKQAYYSDEDDRSDDAHINADLRVHADKLMRSMPMEDSYPLTRVSARSQDLTSGQVTPLEERDPHDYVARPSHYRPGVLGALLRMYGNSVQEEPQPHDEWSPSLQAPNRAIAGRSSSRPPKQKWYNNKPGHQSVPFLDSSSPLGGSRRSSLTDKQSTSGKIFTLAKQKFSGKSRLEEEIQLRVHIRETRQRKKYLDKLCRALMNCGAPSHRLEEYMRMTARVLELEGSFTYFPGTMLMAFEDSTTDTTDLKMVRSHEGVDLGRLRDIQMIYKEVVHDIIGVEEAMQRLRDIMNANPKYSVPWVIFLYGLASAMVGPFAFGARPIDMPICFLLGCVLGVLQHVLTPRSSHYANVFEISAAVITSFFARAFGSITTSKGHHLFCFAALAQSSICLILPGYIVLCGALALQSRNIIAGSVRMVYAIIYSLFLGFGMLIGTALYGALDKNATAAFACPASPIKNEYLQRFPFVIGFAICSSLINQAKFKQLPVMATIAVTGYIVRFFAARQFVSTQISSALGAFAIGIMGNLYSRLGHGLAAAAILPAIFLQLPSGLASSGSLLSSLIVSTNLKSTDLATEPLSDLASDLLGNSSTASTEEIKNMMERLMMNRFWGNVVFDIGSGMLEVAIGISGGLFMAALVVYPFGKRRSGLFSF
ncbi:DUF1212 domain membrane protein Prm10 [Blastomyces gilchristii SLH14081]|uniref:DUF1212 domain membrane protein Prm10 n=1 Tax=Blastomyces gilchristii (strain SLH14081) TaxID=559298 RepID=A0A179UUF4_BLAGS|nr:DUF1212 domain membrane protein Prm10 [Blastomyces gilchristii SLH14081]OAT10788.1 DUF1212 domain membrane protein Prm10 [Blastomyces gilchristii SLH14081]